MKILITGSKRAIGWEIPRSKPGDVEICAVDIDELDITDYIQVNELVDDYRPGLIINAASYTAVDKAESEPETAFAVNSEGAGHLAKAAGIVGARFIHISTDFIFDGSQGSPWKPTDPTNPLGIYGESKLAGENTVRSELRKSALILRTSWLYSSHGNNFVKTMLRLMRERDELGVVADQIGSPTWAKTLAAVVWCASKKGDLEGTFHWADAGVASWYDFAIAIKEEGLAIGLLDHAIPVRPIGTDDYPVPARRPSNSVLDQSKTWEILGLEPLHWREALRQMLRELV